jgi:hypothetical protein
MRAAAAAAITAVSITRKRIPELLLMKKPTMTKHATSP